MVVVIAGISTVPVEALMTCVLVICCCEMHAPALETMITFCAVVVGVASANDGVQVDTVICCRGLAGLLLTALTGDMPGEVLIGAGGCRCDALGRQASTAVGFVRVTTTLSAELLRRRFLPP